MQVHSAFAIKQENLQLSLFNFQLSLGVPPNGVGLSATMLLFVPHKSIYATIPHAPCGSRY
ncbi:hypothetical protein EZS27_014816 [termite gut metagenome]|uniref:Uncharacterized protein n=1 Tax=termite gut metagenome TaxID=433724 RepID=A0A5J4RTG1_9ZZZZ